MNLRESENLFKRIGCRADSTPQQIKSAYRAKMRQVHSDLGGDPDEAQTVNLAWEILGSHLEAYRSARQAWAEHRGALICPVCGEANRVRQLPLATERSVCGSCKGPLDLSDEARVLALKLRAADFVAEMGMMLLDRLRKEVRRRII